VRFEVLIAVLLKIHKYWSVMLCCRESDSDILHSYVTYSPRRLLDPEDESDTILCSAGNHSPSSTVSYLRTLESVILLLFCISHSCY